MSEYHLFDCRARHFSRLLILLACALLLSACRPDPAPRCKPARIYDPVPRELNAVKPISPLEALYIACELNGIVRYDIFRNAVYGFRQLGFTENDLLVIIDYTQPSSKERLLVIDLKNKALLYRTYVAHGVNSGHLYALKFSNRIDSKQSSLGFYRTAETYFGQYGYSLKLDGLEEGFNDLARKRAIVMHGAAYVCPSVVETYGSLGRSWGCPALPENLTEPIISRIQNGSCLYIYADDREYLQRSRYVVRSRTRPDVHQTAIESSEPAALSKVNRTSAEN